MQIDLLLDRFGVFFNETATTEIYTLSLHDALPIPAGRLAEGERHPLGVPHPAPGQGPLGEHAGRLDERRVVEQDRSEEHTSELQSRQYLVCRLLLAKKTRTGPCVASRRFYTK